MYDSLNLPPVSPAMRARVNAMRDEELDYSDIPAKTDFSYFVRANGRNGVDILREAKSKRLGEYSQDGTPAAMFVYEKNGGPEGDYK
jgi:hypothetical protein